LGVVHGWASWVNTGRIRRAHVTLTGAQLGKPAMRVLTRGLNKLDGIATNSLNTNKKATQVRRGN